MGAAPPPFTHATATRNPTLIWLIVAACVVGFCGLLAVVAAILFPVFAQAKESAIGASCLSKSKQIALGHLIYATDNNDRFSGAHDWQDRLTPIVGNPSVFDCPKLIREGQTNGYAMNEALGGTSASKVEAPQTTALNFETMLTGRNAHSGLETLPNPGRHLRKNAIAHADGSAKLTLPEDALR